MSSATDIICHRWLRAHIVEAERYGLGSMHPEVMGDDPGSHVVEFKTPSGLKSNAVLG